MVVFTIILAAACMFLYFSYQGSLDRSKDLRQKLFEKEEVTQAIEQSYMSLVEEFKDLQLQLKKTLSQKKSSEVRTGLIAEQMSPFLEKFPYDPASCNFLARPLDFVVFDDEGVHFVEVKSGEAQLSSKQRKIRDQIKDNKVTFEVYRIKGE